MLTPTLSLPTIIQEVALNVIRVNRTLGRVQGAIARFSRGLADVGVGLSLAVSIPIQLIGASALHAFAVLEDAAIRAASRVEKPTKQMAEDIMNFASLVSKRVPVAAADLAKGMEELLKVGATPEFAMAAIEDFAKFAVVGGATLEKSVHDVLGVISALGMATGNMEKDLQTVRGVINKLSIVADSTVASFDDMVTGVARAAPVMKSTGIEFDQGAAVIGAYHQALIEGSRAGTAMNMMMKDLTSIAIKNRKAWEEFLGRNAIFDQFGRLRPVEDILQDLLTGLSQLTPEAARAQISLLGFQTRSYQATTALFGLTDLMRQLQEKMQQAGGYMQERFTFQVGSVAKQFTLLKNRQQAAMALLGKSMIPLISDLVSKLNVVILAFNRLSDEQRRSIVYWGAVAVSMGPVMIAVSIFLRFMHVLSLIVLFATAVVYRLAVALVMFGAAVVKVTAVALFGLIKYTALAVWSLISLSITTVRTAVAFVGYLIPAVITFTTTTLPAAITATISFIQSLIASGRASSLAAVSFTAGLIPAIFRFTIALMVSAATGLVTFVTKMYAAIVATRAFLVMLVANLPMALTKVSGWMLLLGASLRSLGLTIVSGLIPAFLWMGKSMLWSVVLVGKLVLGTIFLLIGAIKALVMVLIASFGWVPILIGVVVAALAVMLVWVFKAIGGWEWLKGVVVGALTKIRDFMVGLLGEFGVWMVGWLMTIWNGLKNVFGWIWTGLKTTWGWIKKGFGRLLDWLGVGMPTFEEIPGAEVFSGMMDGVKTMQEEMRKLQDQMSPENLALADSLRQEIIDGKKPIGELQKMLEGAVTQGLIEPMEAGFLEKLMKMHLPEGLKSGLTPGGLPEFGEGTVDLDQDRGKAETRVPFEVRERGSEEEYRERVRAQEAMRTMAHRQFNETRKIVKNTAGIDRKMGQLVGARPEVALEAGFG